MAVYVTTQNERIESNLTHREALEACRRIPTDDTEYQFAQSLVRRYDRQGSLTPRQIPYLHRMALNQIARETPTEPAQQPATEPTQPRARRTRGTRTRRQVATSAERANRGSIVAQRLNPTEGLEIQPAHYDVSKAESLDLVTFQYDIPVTPETDDNGEPTGRTDRNGKLVMVPIYPNPSDRLRPFAVRTSGSVWVVPGDRVPHVMINEMREAGCVVFPIRSHPGDVKQQMEMLAYFIQKEMRETIESANDSMNRAGETHATEVKADGMIDQTAKRAQKRLDAYASAADLFGLKLNVASARARVDILRQNAYGVAREYHRAAKFAADPANRVQDGIGTAALADQLQPGILADAILDSGSEEGDAIQNDLRRSFNIPGVV